MPGNIYYYFVVATNAAGNSNPSNIASTLPNPPPAPSNLAATAVSSSQINLSWTETSTDVTGFKIERKTGSGTYAQIGTALANATSYNDTGLTANTSYTYRMIATNASGDSPFSREVTATTLPITAPSAPSNLTATVVSSTQINLSWTETSTDVTGFKIERKTGSGTYAQIGTALANATSYNDTGLTANTSYTYRVRATNTGGDSNYSNEASATTSDNPPQAPTNLAATAISSSAINLTWTDNSNNETGFKVERSTDGINFTQIAVPAANVTTYTDNGLTANTPYTYRVRARNTSGDSDYSNKVTTTTLPIIAPSNLTATLASSTQINLSWTETSTDVTGFKIERKTGSGTYAQIGTALANATSYNDTNLTANTSYTYRVKATNAGGDSNYSNEASATTPSLPIAPSGLTIEAGELYPLTIKLAWKDNSSDETGFKVEHSTDGTNFTLIATTFANATAYSDVGVTYNTANYYRVRATNANGDSAYSNTVVAPAVPSNFIATAKSPTEIDLSWTDNSNNEDGFEITGYMGTGLVPVLSFTTGPNVTTYSNTGLTANTSYSYYVKAISAHGNSAYTNVASATTLNAAPTGPSNLAATSSSSTTINLTWKDNSNNETGFKVERSTDGTNFTQITLTGENAISYGDSGLVPNTTYYYRVRATNELGDSTYSNTATINLPPLPPVAPSSLIAKAKSPTEIDLSWTDNSNNEDGFEIMRYTASGGWTVIFTTGPNVTAYNDTGLTPSANDYSYRYRVRAKNAGGYSDYSNEYSSLTLPTAPINLTASAASYGTYGSINLTWQNTSINQSGFTIERKSGSGTYAQIGTAATNETSYSDNQSLTNNATYTYRVRATNISGNSDYSNEASATTPDNPPQAPTNLVATAISSSAIKLIWTDNSNNETNFVIERSTDGTNFTQIAVPAANVTAYMDNGLPPYTGYTYRVRARNAGGWSDYSNTVSATTSYIPPLAPTNLQATTTSSGVVNLTWTDNSDNETGFKVERSADGGVTFIQIAAPGPNVNVYSDTGLPPKTTYTYRVRATNPYGDSDYSNIVSVTTPDNPPQAPTNLVVTAKSPTQIDLSWTDNSNNETGFEIKRNDGSGSVVLTTGPNATTYSDTGLVPSTTNYYVYMVRAKNAGGYSAYSNSAQTFTLPQAPTNLVATSISSSEVKLTWTDNSNNETSYKIERSSDGTNFSMIAQIGMNTITYSDTNLTANTAYTYRVRATNEGGDSAPSNTANTTTSQSAPAAPSNLTAIAVSTSGQIDLTWTDNSSNEAGFKVERSLDGTTFSEIARTFANTTSYSSTGLTTGTSYFYRVRAYNGGGDSDYSNTASARTSPPLDPSGLSATAISSTEIDLSWADNSNNEAGFKIARSTDGFITYTLLATTSPNVTAYKDNTGLVAGTTYYYAVRATNTYGDSGWSNQVGVTTPQSPPAAPSSLTTKAASASEIDLTWTDNSTNETGFKVERSTDGTNFTQIATPSANATTYSDTGLTANTKYYYRIKAANSAGDSVPSNTSSTTTLQNSPPNAPSGLTITAVFSNRIDLAWTDNSTNETGFKVERSTDGTNFTQIATPSANATTYSDTGLTASTSYTYRVRATNANGDSSYSNYIQTVTSPILPAAPVLTAAVVSSTQINLSWTETSTDVTGFKIERKTGSGTYAQIGTALANATSYNDTNLTANTSYTYRVRATNAGGDSNYSNEANVTTLQNPPPNAPSGLTAKAVSASEIDLTWTDNSNNETNFILERSTTSTFANITPFTLPANTTSYSDHVGLLPGTRYYYRVKATNNAVDSAYSDPVSATTLTLPAAPSGLTALAVSSSQINLTWTDNSNNETGFKLERSTSSAFTNITTMSLAANTTSYNDDVGLIPATTYYYRVKATNANGDSAASNSVSATTPQSAPAAPVLTAAVVSSTQINLSWTETSTDVTGFKIERKTGSGTYAQIGTALANATSYNDTNLTANTSYTYRVRATNAGGDSNYSNEANVTTLQNPPPNAPSNLTATTASVIQINLSWTDNSTNETRFDIERKIGSGGTFARITTVAANVTSFKDTNLTANTSYTYRVRAANAGGNSDYSNETSATTVDIIPAAPSNLTAIIISQTKINLAWKDNSNNEAGFQIERSSGGAFTQIATTSPNVTTYSDTNLTADTKYFYRVRATNKVGNSPYTNTVSARTLPKPPVAPSGLSAKAVSFSQIILTWKDNSNNETGFVIERSLFSTFKEITTIRVSANTTIYSSNGLARNTTYYYRVKAFNTGGDSTYSKTAQATTLAIRTLS